MLMESTNPSPRSAYAKVAWPTHTLVRQTRKLDFNRPMLLNRKMLFTQAIATNMLHQLKINLEMYKTSVRDTIFQNQLI